MVFGIPVVVVLLITLGVVVDALVVVVLPVLFEELVLLVLTTARNIFYQFKGKYKSSYNVFIISYLGSGDTVSLLSMRLSTN